jgi:hypothetical protein
MDRSESTRPRDFEFELSFCVTVHPENRFTLPRLCSDNTPLPTPPQSESDAQRRLVIKAKPRIFLGLASIILIYEPRGYVDAINSKGG